MEMNVQATLVADFVSKYQATEVACTCWKTKANLKLFVFILFILNKKFLK